MKAKAIFWNRIRKVLMVRLDRVGDLICSTPFITTVKRSMSGGRLDVLVTGYTAEVLAGHPEVDRIIVWPQEKERRRSKITELRAENYDLVVALSPISSAYRTAGQIRAPLRAGMIYSRRLGARLMCRVWLTHRLILPVEEWLAQGGKIPHEVEQTLMLAEFLGCAEPCDRLSLPVSPQSESWAADFLGGGEAPIGIPLARRWLAEGWKVADLAELIRALLAAFGQDRWLLTTGAGEESMAAAIIPSLDSTRIISAAGVGFAHWAALLGRCKAVVSPDTGAVHVAAARGVPVAVVYNHSNYDLNSGQWAPWRVPHRLIRRKAPADSASAIIQAIRELTGPAGSQSCDPAVGAGQEHPGSKRN